MPTRAVATFVALVWVLAFAGACASDGDPPAPTAPGSTSSLSPGAVTEALAALCDLASDPTVDAARATFYDRAHVTLHAIAAAAAAEDAGSDAELLIAKQRIEAQLEEGELAPGFVDDVLALRAATAETLEVIGVPAPACAN
jgi:hypothetical protein